jgi:hypothetical protein
MCVKKREGVRERETRFIYNVMKNLLFIIYMCVWVVQIVLNLNYKVDK